MIPWALVWAAMQIAVSSEGTPHMETGQTTPAISIPWEIDATKQGAQIALSTQRVTNQFMVYPSKWANDLRRCLENSQWKIILMRGSNLAVTLTGDTLSVWDGILNFTYSFSLWELLIQRWFTSNPGGSFEAMVQDLLNGIWCWRGYYS